MPPPAASVRRYSSWSVLTLSSSSCVDPGAQGRRLAVGPGSRQVAELHDRVAAPRHAVVVLDDRLRDPRLRGAHLAQRLDDAVHVGDVLPPERVRHAGLGEQAPAARLGPEAQEPRVRAVERDAEREREVALRRRRRERDEMAARRVRDARPDRLDHPRPLQQLRAERPRGAVVRGDHVQPRPRVARDDAGQQREVVLHDRLADRAPGHEHHLQARLAEQQQQEQQALLVRLHHRSVVAGRRGDGRDDDDRLAGLVQAHRAPHVDEVLLEPREALVALVLAQIAEPRLGFQHLAHALVRAASSPAMS